MPNGGRLRLEFGGTEKWDAPELTHQTHLRLGVSLELRQNRRPDVRITIAGESANDDDIEPSHGEGQVLLSDRK